MRGQRAPGCNGVAFSWTLIAGSKLVQQSSETFNPPLESRSTWPTFEPSSAGPLVTPWSPGHSRSTSTA